MKFQGHVSARQRSASCVMVPKECGSSRTEARVVHFSSAVKCTQFRIFRAVGLDCVLMLGVFETRRKKQTHLPSLVCGTQRLQDRWMDQCELQTNFNLPREDDW